MIAKYLCRGKTEEGKWVYGYVFVQAAGTEYEEVYILGELDHRASIYDVWSCAEKVIPETVGRYIELWDVCGVPIYEGDIIEDPIKTIGSKHGDLIVVKDAIYISMLAPYINTYKIIGNIHDNPELLNH